MLVIVSCNSSFDIHIIVPTHSQIRSSMQGAGCTVRGGGGDRRTGDAVRIFRRGQKRRGDRIVGADATDDSERRTIFVGLAEGGGR